MAYEVCSMLKGIAEDQNITVVAVIHSPSDRIFEMFDEVLVLNKKGELEILGDTNSIINDFDQNSRGCINYSPAEYIMMKASRGDSEILRNEPTRRDKFIYALKDCGAYIIDVYRRPFQFLFDQLLHLFCGVFVSLAISNSEYIGKPPIQVCKFTPYIMMNSCTDSYDFIQNVGIFVSLGVTFAGISAGCSTFGYEIIVYWRDASAGMSAIPYFLAKTVADIPRIFIAALMFSLSLIIFYPLQAKFTDIYGIVLFTYISAWMMGYFISIVVSKEQFGLVSTGFALAWGLVFSGGSPRLQVVENNNGYKPLRWLWDISAPRWTVEALYLKELEPRMWQEINTEKLRYPYSFNEYSACLNYILRIAVGWAVLAFLALKLTNRDKQKQNFNMNRV
ncbi:16450_t:CDS:2 [Dentiscutata heterogama]|uniref:16450_t:CDS:1 n=1 Tax=Dentiscutata heterogama TaxID=1316150 RepID=A0ACA9K1Z0_9GLOM|nr:16450_t:CDS:2 [Dentiscutata heterogama]